jgi:cytochrome c-type biogenesis protein CcmH/NrfF
MKIRLTAILFVLLVLVVFTAACSSGSSNTTNSTPASTSALDGATLVQERCSVCHPLGRVESSNHTAAEWNTIVNTMISRGAKLTPEEKTVVVNYLVTNFGK